MEYLPTETEWSGFVNLIYSELRMKRLNNDDTEKSHELGNLISHHLYLSNTLKIKIQRCLNYALTSPWTNYSETRKEVMLWARESIQDTIVQPEKYQLVNSPRMYKCCITDKKGYWNPDLEISSCVRIQFINNRNDKSIFFTVDQSMVIFLKTLSFINHLPIYLERELTIKNEPEILALSNHPMYNHVRQSLIYVYNVVLLHETPSTIESVQSTLEERKKLKRERKEKKKRKH